MSLSAYYSALATMARWTASPSPATLAAARSSWRALVQGGYARADRLPTVRGWPALLKRPDGDFWSWETLRQAGFAFATGTATAVPFLAPAMVALNPDLRDAVGEQLQAAGAAAAAGADAALDTGRKILTAIGVAIVAAIVIGVVLMLARGAPRA